MVEIADGPRVADFGITQEDLERAPCLFLAGHRVAALAGAYLAVAAALFALILGASGSYPAAVFFTVITLAAASVLLLPLLTLVLCASERAEERWLCSRFPKLSACLAYRRAVAEHARTASRAANAETRPHDWWLSAPRDAFVEAARMELERSGRADLRVVDHDATGIDLVVEAAAGACLVRCEPGAVEVGAAVGRELVAAIADRGAARAVIVTAAPAAPALAAYIAERPITVVAPWQLDTIIRI
jgi:HEPN domain-containing protein